MMYFSEISLNILDIIADMDVNESEHVFFETSFGLCKLHRPTIRKILKAIKSRAMKGAEIWIRETGCDVTIHYSLHGACGSWRLFRWRENGQKRKRNGRL